jgi:uncharacterized protein YgbK (DUF1537 family)
MEYIIGSALAVILSGGSVLYTRRQVSQLKERYRELDDKVEYVWMDVQKLEQEMPKKVVASISPVVRSVKDMQQYIGM